MARAIMIQGTASSVGKSLIAAGLCRVFRQDGHSVAPFKSQNMALNSFITREGLEMGRAQVVQAEAAGVEPSVLMNPILLKPTGDSASQVIVNGEVVGNMGAADYYRRRPEFLPAVRSAYLELAARHDILVIEGAGSPAEINLGENDLVNMGMAALAGAPVLLVGDIDRGGVFASLYGTAALLPPEDRQRIRGLVVNKFRGDPELLRPGLVELERLLGIPVLGVVPWLSVDLDDEDSVSRRLENKTVRKPVAVAVIRLPRLANFTDFAALGRHPALGVRYVAGTRELGRPDLLIVPGSKNTMGDLAWMRANGLEAAIKRLAAAGTPILGICGGFQMLGRSLADPEGVELGGEMRGMELLPVATVFSRRKKRTRVAGRVNRLIGFFAGLSGAEFAGYEIHSGETRSLEEERPFAFLSGEGADPLDGSVRENVAGSYVHGLFDRGDLTPRLAGILLAAKGLSIQEAEAEGHDDYKERQYNLLAAELRKAISLESVYRLLDGAGKLSGTSAASVRRLST